VLVAAKTAPGRASAVRLVVVARRFGPFGIKLLPPPPVGPTNAWADDPAAAALGQALFFTPIFAGRLLSGDNNC
jgi:hypothetical protein